MRCCPHHPRLFTAGRRRQNRPFRGVASTQPPRMGPSGTHAESLPPDRFTILGRRDRIRGGFCRKFCWLFSPGMGIIVRPPDASRCAWLSSVFASLPILFDSRPRRAALHPLWVACSWPLQSPRGTAGFPCGLNQTVVAPNDASGVVVAPRPLGSHAGSPPRHAPDRRSRH